MATKRKLPKKAEPIDVSARLAESLRAKPGAESHAHQDAPVIGDIVTVGTGKSELRITRVYEGGHAVDLEFPGTNLERFRIRVDDLHFVERQPREPPKPKIDADDVREDIAAFDHSVVDHLKAEIAVLKKRLQRKKVPTAAEALDDFAEAIESAWKEAVKEIDASLE